MTNFILINNKFIKERNAQISINERGFLFGDGIFETCRIANGKIYNFKAHEARIRDGFKCLKFSADISNLQKNCDQLIKKNKITDGILRISISRGIGSAGYLPTYESQPLIVIKTSQPRKITKEKITLGISKIKKIPKNSLPTSCKTMQGLPYALVKIEAQENKFFDNIILSQKNFISETSSANIFWIKNGKIYTPDKSCDALNGTIRQRLLKISPIKINEVKAKISTLENADEIFLSNTGFLILPVDELTLIKKGKKITKKLQKNFGKEFLKLLEDDVKNYA